jgi:hypothetical protein
MPREDQRQLDGYRIRNLTLLIDSIEEEAPEKIFRQATSGTAGLITNRRPRVPQLKQWPVRLLRSLCATRRP